MTEHHLPTSTPVEAVNRDLAVHGEDPAIAALRSALMTPRWWWPTVLGLAALVVAGIVAWIVQLRDGLGVAGYNDQAFWAVYEADLVTFIGVSYGGAVVSAILRLTKAEWRAPLTRIAEATALVTLPIGMLFIVPHLGSPQRIWELVWPPYWNLSSPILWDFFAVSTYLLATTVFFYLPLVADLPILQRQLELGAATARVQWRRRLYRVLEGRWDASPGARRVLRGGIDLVAIMIIPMAVSVHSVLAFAFASSSRPGYLETIFPVYFVVAALYSGVALVIVVVAALRRAFHLEPFIRREHFVRLGFVMVAFGATYLYLTFTEYLVDGYSSTTGLAAWVHQDLAGRYWVPFWFYFVAAGLVPLLIMAFRRTRTSAGVVTAAGLVLLALWVKRLVIVIPPATEPLVQSPLGPDWGTYHFTWIPILITLAATAAIPLLLLLLFRYVPILSVDELAHAKAPAEERRQFSGASDSSPDTFSNRVEARAAPASSSMSSTRTSSPRTSSTRTSLPRTSSTRPLPGTSPPLFAVGPHGGASCDAPQRSSHLVAPGPTARPHAPIRLVVAVRSTVGSSLGRLRGAGIGHSLPWRRWLRVLATGGLVVASVVLVLFPVRQAGAATRAAPVVTLVATWAHRFHGTVEATRPDGIIGRWVVVVLLAGIICLWITLAALVVRVHRHPREPSDDSTSLRGEPS